MVNKKYIQQKIDENVKIIGNVYIGEGTEIQNGCIIQGPAYIGKTVNLCIIHT